MKISLDWISDFIELPKLPADEIGRKITSHTAEVEGAEDLAKAYGKMVLGEVKSLKKHPGADRLNLVETDIGEKATVQIVCGGQNLFEGMKVAVALPGAWVKWHGEGDPVELSETKIRGEASFGMICAGEEIGLATDNPEGAKEVRICDLTQEAGVHKPGTPLATVLGKEGAVLEIDNKSLTHRPDLWGHYGMAREFSAVFGKPLKALDEFISIPKPEGSAQVKVDIEDNALCPRFSSAIMTGIKIEESPAWMKARILSAGMNPHNNIVDITNYVMLELGQPMHAYDRSVVGDELKVRYAKKGETLLTLEGTEHPLVAEDPLICDGKNTPIGLAGVKGGMHSGIQDSTSEIVLECANFDPIAVRKCAMRQALRTDASQRFEKNLDPTLTETALQRAIHLILELCPDAKLAGPIETVGAWKAKKLEIDLDPARVSSKIGVDISQEEIAKILTSLDFIVNKNGTKLKVEIPSHRATRDVSIEEDLVEEVARIYGYDKIPALLPNQPLELPRENIERMLKHEARRIFALGLGFTEVMTYSFYGKDRIEKCGLTEEGHLKVTNPLSQDQTHMRTSLTPNLLAVIAGNAREKESIRIFEFGHTYKDTGKFMPLEEKRVTGVVAGKTTSKDDMFYMAKGALQTFLKTFRTGNVQLKPSEKVLPYAHPKKSVDVWYRGKNIGVLFSVHPATLKAFDIPLETAVFSINFSVLMQSGQELSRFTPLAKFPSTHFDVSVLVDERRTVEEISEVISSADKENWIQEIKLFDTYKGKNIPEGKKSLSFQVTLRHAERTLVESEFQSAQSAVFDALTASGGIIRGL